VSFSVASLYSLSLEAKPLWGSLSPQEMIEHLVFSVRVSFDKIESKIITPKEKISKAASFVYSKKPLPKNIVVSFFKKPTSFLVGCLIKNGVLFTKKISSLTLSSLVFLFLF